MAKKSSHWIAAILVILIIAVGVLGYLYYAPSITLNSSGNHNQNNNSGSSTTTNAAGQVASPDTIVFTVIDPGLSTAISSAVVTVYPVAGTTIQGYTYTGVIASDSGTAGSNGQFTTAKAYIGGTQLVVEVHKANYVTEYEQVTVPAVYGCQGVCSTAVGMTLPMLNGPTTTLKVADQAGNFFTSNATRPNSGHVSGGSLTDAQLAAYGVYNFTTMATTSQTFTVYVYNTAVGTGWWTSHDQINGLNQNVVLQIQNPNGTATASGFPSGCPGYSATDASVHQPCTGFRTIGLAQYWDINQVDGYAPATSTALAGGITQFKVGSSIVPGSGVQSYSFQVTKGALAHGQAQEWQLQLEQNASATYFVANGNLGPNSATLGSSFTFWTAA